ncbi:shikimate dehydrogenase [Bradyrhizobium sp. 18BD]
MSPVILSPRGTTRLYAVVGDPVAQVQAPTMLNQLFSESAIDAVMVPVLARPQDFAKVFEGLKAIGNLDGMLITIPHKFTVCAHLDRISSMVELSGAANVLKRDTDGRWRGENFDGLGFVAGLIRSGLDPQGKTVALVGAGGAGSAIAAALAKVGTARLLLTDVVRETADRLADRLAPRWPGVVNVTDLPQLAEADIAVNATPLGLRREDPLPFDVAQLSPDAAVAEVIMRPHETALLQAAKRRGLKIQHGTHMLTEQLDLYRQFFGFSKRTDSEDGHD